MKGFKSFGKRTELLFGTDFNCVLGPNGSGKSNILDALCFVLGKAGSKGLRAEKSANLIYNGGKTKNQASEGEVSIYFDNSSKVFPTEDPVVKVTRIVKKDGFSKYKINDKTRTRQQILDLLSVAKIEPDGYNIILQGDVNRIVEMSTIERRQLVEDIAGIGVYEEKKNKAIKELEKVEQKMKEVDIILTERKTHLNELKKDRDQALKYKGLRDRIDQNKASYLKIQIDRKEKNKEKLDKDTEECNDKIKKINENIDSIKKIINEKQTEMQKLNEELEKRSSKEQLEISKQVENIKVSLAANKNRINNLENELLRIAQRKNQLKKDLSDTSEKIDELIKKKKKLEETIGEKKKNENELKKKIEAFKKKEKIEDIADIEKKIDAFDKNIEEKQKKIHSLREDQQNLLREIDKLDILTQTADERIAKVEEVQKENKEQMLKLKNMRTEFKRLTLELNKKLTDDSSYSVKLDELRNKLIKDSEELSKLKARKETINEIAAGDVAIKKILEDKNKLKGIYGTIAQLGNVNAKYSLALEVAAGPKIKSIIVEDDSTAAKCINYLKENKLGVATFIPLNKIKSAQIRPEIEKMKSINGVHDLAINLISFEPRFKKAFSYVFGNTIVVDNINVARRIGIGQAKMTTIDGDSAELSGVMHGGFRQRKGLGFQEKEVKSNIFDLEKNVEKLRDEINSSTTERKKNEEDINQSRREKHELEGEIIKLEKSLHLEDSDLEISKQRKKGYIENRKEVDKKIQEIEKNISLSNSELIELQSEKQKLREKITQLRRPEVLAELNTFEQRKNEVLQEINNAGLEIKNTDVQINDILNRDKENISNILKQQEKEEQKFENELSSLKNKIKEQEKELTAKEEEEKEFYSKFRGLFNKREAIEKGIRKNEDKIQGKNDLMRNLELSLNTATINNASIKANLAGLYEEFKQYENVKIIIKPEEELKKEISEFEKMVEKIGSVNMRALDIYEAVEKEYDELLKKKETLIGEKDDVVNMMNEIEQKKGGLFTKTFDAIDENFKRIFSLLTTKGEAFLELENKEKPFEEGLRIKVRLTGNKFLDIHGLSGGEKSLTALAFIFAIQEYEPASFYVLDEVDAALDKHNSEKLSKLIREYSKKAQYIMISHNDSVISEADSLYGISMEKETGLSKVVSLKL